MSPWKGPRRDSWAKNGNVLNVAFGLTFAAWLAVQVFVPQPARPPMLDQALMAAFGAWLSHKALEQGRNEKAIASQVSDTADKVSALEAVAAEQHPDATAEHAPPLLTDDDTHEGGRHER